MAFGMETLSRETVAQGAVKPRISLIAIVAMSMVIGAASITQMQLTFVLEAMSGPIVR